MIHYNFEELIIDKTNFTITPYFYIKDYKNLSISFYGQVYERNISNLIEINCEENVKIIKINKNTIILDSFKKKFYCFRNKCYFNIIFDRKNMFLNFNNVFNYNDKFKCNWKYLKIKFLVKIFNDFIKISNIQISNNIDIGLEYLKPLIFVDLKQESLNSNNFKNKFDVYHGGINGSDRNSNSKLLGEYNKNLNGVDWIINNSNQFISLDNKVFYHIANKVKNIYSIYLNFDIIYKFLIKDIKKIKLTYIPLYSIYSNNFINLNFMIALNLIIKNNKLHLIFSEAKSITSFYYITLDLSIKNNLEQLLKNGIGLKYLMISYITRNNFKLRVGFKNNSIFYKKSIFKSKIVQIISHFNVGSKNHHHFIGKYNSNKLNYINYYDKYLLCYLIVNEYGIFSGTDVDTVERTDTDINLIIDGNYKLIINNNYNLNRRFDLNNKSKILNCLISNCILCNKNETCLYCKKGYFWDENNNCKYNFNKNYFINEYSELIKIRNNFNGNMLIQNQNFLINPKFFEYLNNKNIFLNIKYENKLNKFNKLNINLAGINNTIFIEKENNLNYFFDNLIISKNFLSLNYRIKIKNNNTILLGYTEVNNNLKEDKFVYKNQNCNNSKQFPLFFDYYYNNKFKKCYSYIKEGYYINTNLLLKCPKNCRKCRYDNLNKNIICQDCFKGYILINNFCFFKNMFKCYNNKLVDIFNNNNDDKIKICDDFCNICNNKNGLICYIRNLNFDFCDKNNIVVYKLINNKINLKNVVTLDLNNKISKCLKGYFLNENQFCEKCNDTCTECTNPLSCSSCKKGYFLKYNKCYSCNIKFKNCNNCSNNKCIDYKFIKKIKITNCKLYINSRCIKCENNFNLINNKCSYKFKNNLNNCYKCNSYKFFIMDGINNSSICSKCKSLIKFNIKQNKNEIILFYDKNVKINESPLLLKLYNIKNYIILFRFKKIIIRIFDKKINNTQLLINKEIIKNGYFKAQIFNISSYSLNFKKLKKIIKKSNKLKIKKKYKFVSTKILNYNIKVSIKYISNFFFNSSFLKIFTPIVVILNLSSLIILWNNNYSKQFLEFMDLFRKKHLFYIDNNIFFSNTEFIKAYEKIKIKYNNNRIIGEIYFFDLDSILLLLMLLVYNLTKLIKNNNTNIILKYFLKYSIYFKLFYFNIIQSNLIKIAYKIIFFSEIYFELNYFFNKLILFLWVNLNILIISHFWYNNYFYCSFFINPEFNYKLNYKDDKIIKLFVKYKQKETRNYNLLMNILDLVIVFIFMLLKNFFIFCILIIIIVIFIKLFYVIIINKKQIKFSLIFNIISFIILLNFFTIILIQYYLKLKSDKTNLIIIWFLLINILEITRLIAYFIIKYYKKKLKRKNLNLIKLFKQTALKNLLKLK